MTTTYILICLSAIFYGTNANAVTPPNLSKKFFRLQTEIDFFRTEANYAADGSGFEELSNGQHYQNLNLKTGGFYSYSRKGAFSAKVQFSNAESQSPTEIRNNTQLSEAEGSFYYQPLLAPFELITSLGLIVPFNRVDPKTDDVLTGEGSFVAKGELWAVKEFAPVTLHIYLGYNFRDEGRSHLLPWSVGGELSFDSFYLGGEVFGLESVTEDEFTNTPAERTTVTDRVNGSSLKFYAVNPSQIAAKIWFGVDVTSNTFLYFGFGQSINGKNSAAELMAYAGFEMSIDMFNNKKPEGLFDRENKKDIDQFEVEAKDYENKLFDKNYQKKRRQKKLKEKNLLNETEDFLENSP